MYARGILTHFNFEPIEDSFGTGLEYICLPTRTVVMSSIRSRARRADCGAFGAGRREFR